MRENLIATGAVSLAFVALLLLGAKLHQISPIQSPGHVAASLGAVIPATPSETAAVDDVSDAPDRVDVVATPVAQAPALPAVSTPPLVTTPAATSTPRPDISLEVYRFATPSAVSTDVPLPSDSIQAQSRFSRPAFGAVPVLMYHYIRVNPVPTDRAGFVLSVTPSDFEEQIRFLWSHGYNPVTMADVREHVRNGKTLPRNPIAITFDDGYDDAYSVALPVLQRYHMTATFYVVTSFLDRPRYMTWNQVIALDRAGMEIASHTVNHPGLPSLGYDAKAYQLTASQLALEMRLGHPVLDFCYPGGQLDVATEQAVIRAGYLSATTTAFGFAAPQDDPYRLPRVRVFGGESLAEFAKLLGDRVNSQDFRRPTPTPIVTPLARLAGAINQNLASCQAIGTRGRGPMPGQSPAQRLCLPQ